MLNDLRWSGLNMGFLRKRTFDHFSRFGIGGLLSILAILILVLLLRVLIILYYVNLLAIFRLPFSAIRGDFLGSCFDKYHNLKASGFNRGSLIDQDGDLDHREEEMGNVVNSEVGNPKPGDRSPTPPSHLPCHENFSDFFSIFLLTTVLNYSMIIMIITVITKQTKWTLCRRERRTDHETKAKHIANFVLDYISGNRGAPGILSHPG